MGTTRCDTQIVSLVFDWECSLLGGDDGAVAVHHPLCPVGASLPFVSRKKEDLCCRGDEHCRLTEKRWCVQLSLVAEVWHGTTDAPQVCCLWRMNREKRVLVWEELQPQLQLCELELGGETGFMGTKCPVDDEELAVLCPKGSLHQLQRINLHAANRVTDSGLEALASAGCGAQLTSLTLLGE